MDGNGACCQARQGCTPLSSLEGSATAFSAPAFIPSFPSLEAGLSSRLSHCHHSLPNGNMNQDVEEFM
jgi:hypothetical protein